MLISDNYFAGAIYTAKCIQALCRRTGHVLGMKNDIWNKITLIYLEIDCQIEYPVGI